MRHYEISQEVDGFQFICRAVPPEVVPGGYHESFVFTQCTELDAHRLATIARQSEQVPIFDLFDILSKYPM